MLPRDHSGTSSLFAVMLKQYIMEFYLNAFRLTLSLYSTHFVSHLSKHCWDENRVKILKNKKWLFNRRPLERKKMSGPQFWTCIVRSLIISLITFKTAGGKKWALLGFAGIEHQLILNAEKTSSLKLCWKNQNFKTMYHYLTKHCIK
jgi:hypothetical protein